jgi:hypothetical protein
MSVFESIRQLLPTSMASLFSPPEASPFTTPTYADVCHARALFTSLRIPTELTLLILDYAEYYPTHTVTTSFNEPTIAGASGVRSSACSLSLSAALYANSTTDSIRAGKERPKVKSVVFNLVSRDQGWTSENTRGTYATSSWHEVSILRNRGTSTNINKILTIVNVPRSSPKAYQTAIENLGWELVKRPENALQGPQGGEGDHAWYLQGNRVMARMEEYRVVWSEEGREGNEGAGSGEGFVRALQDGDTVLVWARSKARSSPKQSYAVLTDVYSTLDGAALLTVSQ